MMKLITIILTSLIFITPTLTYADTSPKTYVIGLSSFMTKETKDKVWTKLNEFLLDSVKPGNKIVIYDASISTKIVEIDIPEDDKYLRQRSKVKFISKRFSAVKKFFKNSGIRNEFDGKINFPIFIRKIANDARYFDKKVSVILFASAFLEDAREGNLYTRSGFPSDGHLKYKYSVFNTIGYESSLLGFQFHYIYLDEDQWVNDIHRKKLERFTSLFLTSQGGDLVTFSSDLMDYRNSMRTDIVGKKYKYNLSDEKPVMHTIRHVNNNAENRWLRGSMKFTTTPPPTNYKEKIKVGISWSCSTCDVDLYLMPHKRAKILSYKQTGSNNGRHIKDYRTSPNAVQGYETVELFNSMNVNQVREMKTWVNFYSGSSSNGIKGEIRILYGDKVYRSPFTINVTSGNKGAGFSNNKSNAHWRTLDLLKIMRLK